TGTGRGDGLSRAVAPVPTFPGTAIAGTSANATMLIFPIHTSLGMDRQAMPTLPIDDDSPMLAALLPEERCTANCRKRFAKEI
ncbi:MAG: hypothetical protein WC540_06920, partial [Sulfuritalea sp.]